MMNNVICDDSNRRKVIYKDYRMIENNMDV